MRAREETAGFIFCPVCTSHCGITSGRAGKNCTPPDSAPGEAPVWPHPQGSTKGPSLSPIYKSAPAAALADPALHRCLALLDALRSGRLRERTIAMKLLQNELSGHDAKE